MVRSQPTFTELTSCARLIISYAITIRHIALPSSFIWYPFDISVSNFWKFYLHVRTWDVDKQEDRSHVIIKDVYSARFAVNVGGSQLFAHTGKSEWQIGWRPTCSEIVVVRSSISFLSTDADLRSKLNRVRGVDSKRFRGISPSSVPNSWKGRPLSRPTHASAPKTSYQSSLISNPYIRRSGTLCTKGEISTSAKCAVSWLQVS